MAELNEMYSLIGQINPFKTVQEFEASDEYTGVFCDDCHEQLMNKLNSRPVCFN